MVGVILFVSLLIIVIIVADLTRIFRKDHKIALEAGLGKVEHTALRILDRVEALEEEVYITMKTKEENGGNVTLGGLANGLRNTGKGVEELEKKVVYLENKIKDAGHDRAMSSMYISEVEDKVDLLAEYMEVEYKDSEITEPRYVKKGGS